MTTKNPLKVFISYSWDSEEHKTWVRMLAEKLVRRGVDIILDQWHLQPTDDRIEFMNRITTCDWILMICTPKYVEKADEMKDGVGDEQAFIVGEATYNKSKHKYISILRRGKKQPGYFGSKIYLDFTEDAQFEDNFDSLLRTIYQKPKYVPPDLGPVPDLEPIQNEFSSSKTSLSPLFSDIREQTEYKRKIELLGDQYSLEILIGNRNLINFFPENVESRWLLSCTHFSPPSYEIKSFPDYYLAETENLTLKAFRNGVIYTQELLYTENKIHLPIIAADIIEVLLYYYQLCQYKNFEGEIEIKTILSNIKKKSLFISQRHIQTLKLPEGKSTLDYISSISVVSNHMVLTREDDLYKLMTQIIEYLAHSFGFSDFELLKIMVGDILGTSTYRTIKSRRMENFTFDSMDLTSFR